MPTMRLKAIAILAVSLLVATVQAAPAHANALADIKAAGVLRVAVPQDAPPFGMAGLDLQPIGYDIDVAKLIAAALHVKVELTPVTGANRVPYLQTKRVDLIISSLGKTAEREKVIAFSQAYAPFFSAVYGRPGGPTAAGPADLGSHSVGIGRGTLEDLELSKTAAPTAKIVRFEDGSGATAAFLSGQVDMLAIGNAIAATIAERNPARRPVLQFRIKDSPCYVGLNLGEQALLDQVNAAITAAKSDGTLEKLSQKWFHEKLPADL